MKKRIIGLVLVVFLLLAGVCFAAVIKPGGDGESPAEATVESSGTCGDGLTWTLSGDGVLTISGKGEMENYNQLASDGVTPWGIHRDEIRTVVAESGVEVIGAYAFLNCTNLEEVRLEEGVLRIGACAFQNCVNLRRVTLPESLTTIWGGAFYNCASLQELALPDSVESIGGDAFQGTGLTELNARLEQQALERQAAETAEPVQTPEPTPATPAVTGWQKVNGIWYFYDENGVMQTGWIEVKGKRYYLNEVGEMQTGWVELDGKQYYLDSSGAAVSGNRTINGKQYFFNSEGQWVA